MFVRNWIVFVVFSFYVESSTTEIPPSLTFDYCDETEDYRICRRCPSLSNKDPACETHDNGCHCDYIELKDTSTYPMYPK